MIAIVTAVFAGIMGFNRGYHRGYCNGHNEARRKWGMGESDKPKPN